MYIDNSNKNNNNNNNNYNNDNNSRSFWPIDDNWFIRYRRQSDCS